MSIPDVIVQILSRCGVVLQMSRSSHLTESPLSDVIQD
uniref:Uncharacterized protein n=1 Tax=Trichinella nativa TaxID=6335 RepID=A0A0V1KIS1_9BILA